jgi:hypothetical protein
MYVQIIALLALYSYVLCASDFGIKYYTLLAPLNNSI